MAIGRAQIGVQFGWNSQSSAYQNLKTQRARIGKYLGGTQSALSSIGSALTGAATNKISGLANLAAQKAVDRIQAQVRVAMASRDKQLADAQSTLQATQSSYNSSALANIPNSSGGVLNTSA